VFQVALQCCYKRIKLGFSITITACRINSSFYAFGSKFAFFFLLCFQLVIDKNKPVVRFGMMHLTATNVCVVIVTIITETAEDYRFEAFSSLNVTKGIIKIL
jgi:steroid 5-alpha reductase family enzyme